MAIRKQVLLKFHAKKKLFLLLIIALLLVQPFFILKGAIQKKSESSIINQKVSPALASETFEGENKWEKPLDISPIAQKNNLTGKDITIAFLDTGININHECFQRFEGDIPFISTGDVSNPLEIQDVTGHGTHVTSIALGNSSSFRGIAPEANAIMVNVFDGGNLNFCHENNFVEGLHWLLDYQENHPIDILSISVGTIDEEGFDQIENLMKNFTDLGITVVVSAGNNGKISEKSILSPATSPHVISVGGFNGYNWSIFESSGSGPTLEGFQKPDIIAPAVEEWGANYSDEEGYLKMTGCSQATPMVAGLIALLLQHERNSGRNLDWSTIKWLLSTCAMNYDGESNLRKMDHDNREGWGIAQLGSIINFLERNSSKGPLYPNESECIEIGGGGYSHTSLIPINLRKDQNYRITINNSNAQLGLFSSNLSTYGEPKLLFSSEFQSSSLMVRVNQTEVDEFGILGNNTFYIAVKTPPNAGFQQIMILIEPYSHQTLFMYLIVIICSVFGLGIIVTNRSQLFMES